MGIPTAFVITGWFTETNLAMITLSLRASAAMAIAANPLKGTSNPAGPTVMMVIPTSAITAPAMLRRRSFSIL
jgi:hypothetical protein